MKNKYNEILYREVAPKRNTGIAELIGAPLLAIAALVLWVRDGSNQYIEERRLRRRRDKDY